MKTALAKKNGYNKERYTELVRKRVKAKYPNKADEISLLRKEVALLRREVEALKGEKLPETKFTVYNEKVESIKAKAKEETT